MLRTAGRGFAVVAALALAACSSGAHSTSSSAPPGPARGATESAGRITISVLHGVVTEHWPRVSGADSYVLTASGAATVRLPADCTSYRWAAPRVPSDLTAATVAPRGFSVTASAHGTVLRRFTYLQPCAALAYVAARGSGQNGAGSAAYADGLGDLGGALLTDLRRELRRDQWQLPAVAVAYPATAVDPGTDLASLARFLHDYDDSVSLGVADTVRVVAATAARCPQTRFVLSGFSQGAQVIGTAYASLSAGLRDRVADVVLFADPQYRPDDPRVTYLPERLPRAGILGARAPFPAAGPAVVQSWCWAEDIVCQQPPGGTQFHGPIYNSYAVAAARLTARGLH